MIKASLLAAAVTLATLATAQAGEVEVKMLTRGETGMMVFEPAVVHVQPGDTVRFVPVDPGHNAESLKGMIPDGAEPFKGGIGKEIAVTFTVEGVYGYDCMPHYGMGMVGLVVVGDADANAEAAQAVKQRGRAAGRFATLFTELNG
jgi:pseudoazurin